MAWPHVVLANGRLFCKDRAGNLKGLALGKIARAQLAKTLPESVLCKIEAGRPYHCLVSYGNSTVACYLNGAEVYRETGRVTGDFSNWTAQHLLVGDEWDDPRPWRGRVEGFAFYTRASDATFA